MTMPAMRAPHSPRHLAWLLLPAALLLACQATEQRALPTTASPVAERYAVECDADDANACFALGLLYALPGAEHHGLVQDDARSAALLSKACTLGHAQACAPHAAPPPPDFDRPSAPAPPLGSGTPTERGD
jgi:TPR repeat protein